MREREEGRDIYVEKRVRENAPNEPGGSDQDKSKYPIKIISQDIFMITITYPFKKNYNNIFL